MKSEEQNYWKRVVFLLCLGWASIWIYRTMLTPIYAEIQGTIGEHSSLEMGLISSMYFFGYVATQIPSGLLMDRIGKKTVMVPGFVLFLVGIITIGFASSIHMLYVGSVLAGIGTGAYYSGAFSLSSDHVPAKYKYFATALINNGCAFGMIIGYLSGGFFVRNLGMKWNTLVFLCALFVLIVTIFFAFGLKKEEKERKHEEHHEKINYKIFFAPKMLTVYFMYFSTCYGYYMIVTWLPSFLETERGFSGGAASVYACIVAAVSIPGAMFLGKVLDRFNEKRVFLMMVLQIGSAIMIVLISKFEVLPLLIVCLAVYGLCGKQAIDPLIVPHVSGGIPDKLRSTGLGIFNFFGMSGSIACFPHSP